MNIPVIEMHRGVGIHDFQDREHIETIVKPEIDRVFAISDPVRLFEFASNKSHCPEARLFAGDKYKAAHELAAATHELRPGKINQLNARLAGLDCLEWISRDFIGSSLEPRPPGPETRVPRPPECRDRLAHARAISMCGSARV